MRFSPAKNFHSRTPVYISIHVFILHLLRKNSKSLGNRARTDTRHWGLLGEIVTAGGMSIHAT